LAAPIPTASAAKQVDAPAATVLCQVTWIIVLVVPGPPKGLDGGSGRSETQASYPGMNVLWSS
jgi:hypothetical protein